MTREKREMAGDIIENGVEGKWGRKMEEGGRGKRGRIE